MNPVSEKFESSLLSLSRNTPNLPLMRNSKVLNLFLTQFTFKYPKTRFLLNFWRNKVTSFKASHLLEILWRLYKLLTWVIFSNDYGVYSCLDSHGQRNVYPYFCSKFVKDNWQISLFHLIYHTWKQYQNSYVTITIFCYWFGQFEDFFNYIFRLWFIIYIISTAL